MAFSRGHSVVNQQYFELYTLETVDKPSFTIHITLCVRDHVIEDVHFSPVDDKKMCEFVYFCAEIDKNSFYVHPAKIK